MSSFNDLFNPGGVNAPVARNTDEYKVSYKDGKGGIYESVVRFIPYVNDPAKSLMTKQVSWVKNPVSKKGMYVDDPRTIGEYSPIIDMFFKFRNSGNAQLQEFGKEYLSTKLQYAALVQIIKDDNHPELVGKIKVFKFGKKVWDKLYNEEHPAIGTGHNPFHPIDGRYFYIKCVSSAGFNNFDQSVFIDNDVNGVKCTGFYFADPANGGQLTPVTASSDQQAVADYLAANSPDLGKYDYHPWTSDQQQHVDETLALMSSYLQGGNIQAQMQTVNTNFGGNQGGFKVNNNPTFPGMTHQQEIKESANAQQVSSTPQVSSQPNIGQMNTPQPNVKSNNVPGLSLGGDSINGVQQQGPVPTPNIVGIDIPQVESPNVGVASGPGIGIGGNIDDVIANL